MTTKRREHGCSTLQFGTKSFGVVSGGSIGISTDSTTQWIDFDEDSPTWTEGPKLPRGLESPTLVESTQGTYALGGSDGRSNRRSEVLKLDCPGNQIERCQWQEMEEKLEFGRYNHVSIALPESSEIICSGQAKIHYDFITISAVLSIVFLFSWSA